MTQEIFLDIEVVLNVLEATPSCRNFKEGEALLNARHLILCGVTKKSTAEIYIFALCLQTSGINKEPHEISGCIKLEKKITIHNMTCSCKAGTSGKCKHISATLLHCTRNDVMKLEVVSSTDKKCLWKEKKVTVLHQYQPMPLLDTDCFKNSKLRSKAKFQRGAHMNYENIASMFLKACPNSALALHRVGRSNVNCAKDSEVVDVSLNEGNTQLTVTTDIILNILSNKNNWMEYVRELDLQPLHQCCKDTYANKIICGDPIKLCMQTHNNKMFWKNERQFRITGSRCYGIFTYGKINQNKVNWDEKSKKYFWPKNVRTSAMEYGIKNESAAREAYKTQMNVDVIEAGLIVHKENPWLGYSPDGIVVKNGVPTKLLEIKCIVAGKDSTITEAIKGVKYVTVIHNNIYSLKKKHMYYGQIQLGMAMLNLTSTDFVIFSSKDGTFITINVVLDEDFVKNLLYTLKFNYFRYMLHTLCIQES